MKRYLLFFTLQYSPKGGMNDFVKDFDDLNEAKEVAKKMILPYSEPFESSCHVEVYDLVLRQKVYEEGTWNKIVNPKESFCIALPHITPKWNLEGFVQTVEPELWKHFVISDHSKNQDCKFLEDLGAEVHYIPNGSISAAWNRALKKDKDFTIICSVSMRFFWSLERVIDEFRRNLNDWAAETQWGFHLAAVTRDLVNKVGMADENFQAYAEDSDWRFRWNLAGLNTNRFNVSATLIGLGIAMKTGEINIPSKQMDRYYIEKWGNVSGKEIFTHPYNESDKPVSYWRILDDSQRIIRTIPGIGNNLQSEKHN